VFIYIGARVGKPDPDLLLKINKQCFVINRNQAVRRADKDALWIAPTAKKVEKHNKAALELLKSNGATVYRSVAIHTTDARTNTCIIDERTSASLFKSTSDKLPATDIEYAIGQRVRVTTNSATQIGIYNGALGTVHSFGFIKTTNLTNELLNPTDAAYKLSINRKLEQPIIYVQMDKLEVDSKKANALALHTQYSCDDEIPCLMPFSPIMSDMNIKFEGKKYYRHQYPLLKANAATAHKSQGITAFKGTVLDLAWNDFKAHGMAYVALSRNKVIEGMITLHNLLATQFEIAANYKTAILNEYNRLRNIMI
jgi:hypothetical protein